MRTLRGGRETSTKRVTRFEASGPKLEYCAVCVWRNVEKRDDPKGRVGGEVVICRKLNSFTPFSTKRMKEIHEIIHNKPAWKSILDGVINYVKNIEYNENLFYMDVVTFIVFFFLSGNLQLHCFCFFTGN